jgi:hypothetical protein
MGQSQRNLVLGANVCFVPLVAMEAEWIKARHKLFEARFEALDELINEMAQEEGGGSAR